MADLPVAPPSWQGFANMQPQGSRQVQRTSWKYNDPSWHAPTTNPENSTLYQWGPLQFQVHPLNLHEVEQETESDWAPKEIAGAAIYHEWVGENDNVLHVRGRLFPYRIGGMNGLQSMEVLRLAGVVNMMVRGDGDILGWYALRKLHQAHHLLSAEGVGQQIDFEAQFMRMPVPEAAMNFNQLWSTIVP